MYDEFDTLIARTALGALADEEIAALQVLQKASYPIERWPYLREGDFMRIEGGALDGLVGRFIRAKSGCRMVVSVTLLQRSVSVEINPSRLTRVQSGTGMQYTAHNRERVIPARSQSELAVGEPID